MSMYSTQTCLAAGPPELCFTCRMMCVVPGLLMNEGTNTVPGSYGQQQLAVTFTGSSCSID